MNKAREQRRLRDEKGAVLPYILVSVFFLSFLWILSLSRTTGEFKWVGFNRQVTDQFYAADAALAVAYENKNFWMTDAFHADIENDAATAVLDNKTMIDENGDPLGTLAFRPIQDEDEAAAAANNLPVQRHEVSPPEGSGHGMKFFVIKRFGVTSVSPDGSRQIQSGAWVLQNK